MASNAADSATVIQTGFEPAVLHTIPLQAAEQLLHVLLARPVERLFTKLDICLPVFFRYDNRPVGLCRAKLLPRTLSVIEKLLQIVLGAHVLDRHRRLITRQYRHMKRGILFPELI